LFLIINPHLATELSKQTHKNVIKHSNTVPEIIIDESAKQAHIWSKAKEAQAAGDNILSKVLLKAYRELGLPAKPPTSRSVSAHPVLNKRFK
jgi:hypothetical protein